MLSLLLLSTLGSAYIIPRETSTCCFSLVATGDLNSTVQETTDGLLQLSGTAATANICVNGTTFYDSANKTLGVQSDNSLQCTSTATSPVLSFSDNYNLLHDGDETWYACESDGSYTIAAAGTGCKTIKLLAGGFSCAALGSSTVSASATTTYSNPGSSATSSATTTATASANTTVSCPSNIAGGTFAPPHLIVPVSSLDPDVAFGNSYDVTITPDNTTLINFDIPTTYTGTCALIFEFPWAEDEDPNSGGYEFSGLEEEEEENGGLAFSLLSAPVTALTTFNTQPSVSVGYGKTEIFPGNNYTIATFACPAGQTASYSIASVNNVVLEFFQDDAPQAIGLYVVPC